MEKEFFPRTVTDRNNALYLCINHFCVKWKSEIVSFNQAINDLKYIVKLVDNHIPEENVNSHFKFEFIPKKTESHLTNFIVYDLITHNTDRTRPYNMTFYRISKLAGRYSRDSTPYEIDKCKNDTLVFDGDNCVGKASHFFIKIQRRRP